MLEFSDSLVAAARPRDVWKILNDPARFPEWWAGLARTEVDAASAGRGHFTAFLDAGLYQDMDPARPMAHAIHADRSGERVVISCMVAEIEFEWRLAALDDGRRTRIDVHLAVPERVSRRFQLQRTIVEASLRRLARMAEDAAG